MKDTQQHRISWLPFLRIGVASLCLANFLVLQADFDLLFYDDAYSMPEISRFISPGIVPVFYDIHNWTLRFANIEYNDLLLLFRIIYPLALVSLLIGFYSRVSAIIALVLFVLFVNSYNSLIYGFDVFANFCLFYCVIFPVGKYDAVTKNKFNPISSGDNKYLYLLRAHICVAYFFSGFEKMLGMNWRNGESLWKAVHLSGNEWPLFNALAPTPFYLVFGWITIILEMLYPIFMNHRTTRKIWLAGIVGMHFFIAVFMGLYFFSGIMIIINLAVYYIPFCGKTRSEKNPKTILSLANFNF